MSSRTHYVAAAPECDRPACFGCKEGKCTILVDNSFSSGVCPFFKLPSEVHFTPPRPRKKPRDISTDIRQIL